MRGIVKCHSNNYKLKLLVFNPARSFSNWWVYLFTDFKLDFNSFLTKYNFTAATETYTLVKARDPKRTNKQTDNDTEMSVANNEISVTGLARFLNKYIYFFFSFYKGKSGEARKPG